MMLQQLFNRNKQRRSAPLVLLLLLVAATLLWILNNVNIIQGSWAVVLNAAFTGIGAILSLLQWHMQTLQEGSRTNEFLPDQTQREELFREGAITRRRGMVLVYANRKWRGITLHLMSGFQETSEVIEAASNIVERQIGGRSEFLCHFPAVPPGHYTLVAFSKQRRVHVTVRPGHLSEIDWR